MRPWLLALAVTLAAPSVLTAQPHGTPEVVYGLTAFDGQGYAPAFAPRHSQTIYLLEGVVNVVTPRRTHVYFWPLTEQYLPDWEALNEELSGRLRITRAGQIVRELEKQFYALVYPRGLRGPRALAIGEEAGARYAESLQRQREYEEALEAYSRARLRILEERQRQGRSAEDPPTEPSRPVALVSKPAKAFLVTLPAGTYRVALLDAHGNETEGSQRDLMVFRARRKGVGYQVIPPGRWNDPVQSASEQDVVYISGQASLYLQPHAAQEFNEAFHARLLNPQDRKASEGRWVWVLGEPDFTKPLRVAARGQAPQEVTSSLYVVEQVEGARLGYRIVKQDRSELHPQEHGFRAYEVVIPPGASVRIWLRCGPPDDMCPRSARWVTTVRRRPLVLYLAAAFPLVLGMAVVGARRFWIRSSA